MNITNINFYENFKDTINSTEFFDIPGREHYRLLAYLSTLYDNSIILDIGTHVGSAALALSYNKSNTIYSFDIIDKVTNIKIKEKDNIIFSFDNLFTKEGRNKWESIILKSSFIFLDVDPHNGYMEKDFYNYLQFINYQGFVICDDIWYFKEMRDNFWYTIPDKFKYDLTDLGHWSGTGIISFNKNNHFKKYDNSDWTLVTAYFNLTKCIDASTEIKNRDQDYYLSHSLSTLSLPYNLVIYCDEDSLEKIKKLRPEYLTDKTKYIVREFSSFTLDNKNFTEHTLKIIDNRQKYPYQFDNRNTASYYLFCMSRYIMLKETIDLNPFNSTHFCWINFCIERMGFKNLIRLNEALSIKRDKFSTCYIDYVPYQITINLPEYFRYGGRCGMCSGFFTGNKEYMYKVCTLICDKFLEFLNKGYGHADEQLYSPVYFENPDLFEHYYGDYQQMITNYRYIYDAPEPPIYNFIKNSFENNNFRKCLEACNFVMTSYYLNKCSLNKEYLEKLIWYLDQSRIRL